MNSLLSKLNNSLEEFRLRLSYRDALPQLVSLGVLSGIGAGLLIVAFRWLIEISSAYFLDESGDNFESLSVPWRFLLPLTGAMLIGGALSFIDKKHYAVSVSHVLERLHNHQGVMPLRNVIVQFCGGVVALVSGQSVGREGPGIHLGAGVGSLIGQWLHLPNNSLRTLVACGSAAGISATFNTPMAGVIFAMEVILMEYTIVGFIPVIIASVLAATISQLVFGADINFVVNGTDTNVLIQLPYLVFAGIVFSMAAALFIRLHLMFVKMQSYSIMLRMTFIGLVTGTIAVFVPEIMGAGYDSLNQALLGELGVALLISIVVAKLLVTATATGLGMVGGLIGPTLVVGGCLGALLGILGNTLVPNASNPDFYILLGMVAMMGAVLNAPLAALVAILELSSSAVIIFPSMFTVVVACLGVKQIFKYEGIFAEQLKLAGHDVYASAGKNFLSRIGVQSVMNRAFVNCKNTISNDEAQQLIASENVWLIISNGNEDNNKEECTQLVAMAKLARFMENPQLTEDKELDLSQLSAKALKTVEIEARASLQEANTLVNSSGADAVLVIASEPDSKITVGVVTKSTIASYHGM
ncbi:MAG: chloride channel protein [Pseudomonadales bacterium]|nr:chloride channel protein [Pseudomonadales bacterium]